MRRCVHRPLTLERLEDRIAPASDITIIASGVGSLDSVLQANNGVITVNDGANGGTQAETLSAAALHSLAATDNINIAARNSITFDDLTPIGGTLALGNNASFSTNSGAITFVNTANSLTSKGSIQFAAGTNLTLADLKAGGNITLTTGAGGTFTSGTGGTEALISGGNNLTISADNIVLNTGISATSGSVTLQQATGGGLFTTTRSIDIGGGNTAGDLNISDAELGLITASALQIGRTDNAGNITVTGGGITAHAGFTELDLRSGGSITEADAKATIAVQHLDLSASTGIGASQAPLETQVGFLQAQTATGGIFITNGSAAPTPLTLEGQGVQVTGASGDIRLINNGAININNLGAQGALVQGPGNVTVQANGATADVVVAGQSAFGGITGTGNGVVMVQAGRDITLGDANFGDVVSKNGSIVVDAGRNLTLNSSASVEVEGGAGTIAATAGGNITMIAAPTGFAGPLVLTQGGAISLTTGAGGTFTADALNEANAVVSNGGDITVSADNIVLNKALNAGSGIVTLQQATGGTGSTARNIDIGGATAGALDLSDAELNEIIAGVLRIGRLDNAGNIGVTENAAKTGGITAHAGFNTLDLRSGGAIESLDNNATIAVTNLALQSVAGSFIVGTVTTLAGSATLSGGAFAFGTTTNLTIGSVDGVNGISTNDDNIFVQASGALTVTDTPAANDINSRGGEIKLTSASFVNSGTTTAGAAIATGGGVLDIIADNMDLQAGSSLDAGAGLVILTNKTTGTPIDLGGADSTSPLTLGLTAAELNTITADALEIGSSVTGNLTVSAAIAPAHVNTLLLSSAAAIFEATNGSLAVPNLILEAADGIGDNDIGPLQVVGPINVAFQNTTMDNVVITSSGAMTITAVAFPDNLGVNNIGNLADGVFLTANNGPLTFAVNTTINSLLKAVTTGSSNGQNNITVNSGVSLQTLQSNDAILQSADNIVLQTGSTIQSKAGNVLLFIGSNDSDSVSATLQGTLNGTAPIVQASNGNASLLVDFANGANLPNGLTFTGGAGDNSLIVSDQNDATAHNYTLTARNIVRDGATINYTNVANVTVTGGSQSDTFNVTPSATTTFTVNGGNPTPPTLPGDTLNVNLAGITAPQLIDNFNADGFAGAWTFGKAEAVHFTGMETLLPTAGLADLAVTASGPAGNLFGSTLTYTYTLTNNGPSAAPNVTLTAALPTGAKVVSAGQVGGTDPFTSAVSGSSVTFSARGVGVGNTETFQVVISVAGGAGRTSSLRSTATVTSDTSDPNGGNNAAMTPDSLLSVVSNQLQADQQAAGQVHTLVGEITAFEQFLFWFDNASAVSGGAVNLLVDELFLALGEMATADGLPLQGFVNAQEQAIAANPLYDTVSGYELGLWSGALASILF